MILPNCGDDLVLLMGSMMTSPTLYVMHQLLERGKMVFKIYKHAEIKITSGYSANLSDFL